MKWLFASMVVALFATAAVVTSGSAWAKSVDSSLSSQSPASTEVIAQSEIFGMRWRNPVVRTGLERSATANFGSPAFVSELKLVVIGTAEGEVRAFTVQNGDLRWRYHHDSPFEGEVVTVSIADKPHIVIGSRDGALLALNAADGSLTWKTVLDGGLRSGVVVRGDDLFIATAANKVARLSKNDGKIIWSAGRPASTRLSIQGVAQPLLMQDQLIMAYSDGYVGALSLDTGAAIWSLPISLSGGVFIDADATPIQVGKLIIAASYSDGVFAIESTTGKIIWQSKLASVISLALVKDKIVAASADGFVWLLNPQTGVQTGQTRLPSGVLSSLFVDQGLILFAAGESGLIALNADDLKPLQTLGYGARFASMPVLVGTHMAALSLNGYLYSFNLGGPGRIQ